ncbi:hypothetical protein IP84_04415 [beta proteobacterium AAP99]|nr:hypothetical protein IP84_04415 [beta proteobacterium AAP99]
MSSSESSAPAVDAASDPLSLNQDLHAQLTRIITQRRLQVHFQPIIDLQRARIVGFEALIRGPADSPLHSPLVLFDVAARLGWLVQLERLAVRMIIQRFVELRLPGLLFVNVTADVLMASEGRHELLAAELRELGLPATRVVAELTETRPVEDPARLDEISESLRTLGFRFALDDLGEGFASLKRWSLLRPNYVKIDRHFIDGVSMDPVKQQFVRSILEMARGVGCEVIAEGVEQASDLRTLQGMGAPLAQGYLIARPVPAPRVDLAADVESIVLAAASHRPASPLVQRPAMLMEPSAADLARPSPCVSPQMSCAEVIRLFHDDDNLFSLPVVDHAARPVGLLRSAHVLKRGAERYFMDLFGRSSCEDLMDPQPVSFDAATSLRQMSEVVARMDERHLVDGFIVTREGRYAGVGRLSDLIKAVSDLQIRSARHANPLTGLPGNVPIESQLDSYVRQRLEFTAVYWDLDFFKPFNDVYGYQRGDEAIAMTAQILEGTARECGAFVGHVGGDDFVALLTGHDWQPWVERVLATFDIRVRTLFDPEHIARGGYDSLNRQGQMVFHPLLSLSAGVLPVGPGEFDSARQIAPIMAELKSMAKRQSGSSWFCERRAIGQRTGVFKRVEGPVIRMDAKAS